MTTQPLDLNQPQTVRSERKPVKKFYKKLKTIQRFSSLYLLFLPVFVFYIVFSYAPMGGVVIAFKNYTFNRGIIGSEWVGLSHFERFISNGDFWVVFKNTFLLALYRMLFGFPAPIIFAILLYELRFAKLKRLLQTVSYLPHFISWVVVYGLMYNFFSIEGIINQVALLFGSDATNFLGETRFFRPLFVGSSIWKEVGWGAIIYLAALTNVSSELLEAAWMDGANRWQRLWHITLPSIRSIISIMFVLSFGGILSVSFEQILVMYNPIVSSVADVIDYYIYRVGLLQANNYSYATAVGLFRSVLALMIVLTTNWVAKKIEEEGAIW
ncbi:MAG: sugar transporter permease [Paenibacillaceae bacterium]|jgi:putative aldouronate transport system permease protein|nr:sugar transporter permease [Paenibacillaceae bacterium]